MDRLEQFTLAALQTLKRTDYADEQTMGIDAIKIAQELIKIIDNINKNKGE